METLLQDYYLDNFYLTKVRETKIKNEKFKNIIERDNNEEDLIWIEIMHCKKYFDICIVRLYIYY